MPEASTPDSIPSLGDVTTASSDTEEGAKDDVTRVLFPSAHQRKWEDFIARMKANLPTREAERESLFDSDQSILGSDQSVAFLDLAVDASSIVDSQVERTQRSKHCNLVRTSSDSHISDVGARDETVQTKPEPSVAEKFAARFTGPLSASQLASIFSLCDGGDGVIWSKTPTEEVSQMADRLKKNVTVEEPIKASCSGSWMPRAQSLARECATLKEIIRVDSANILHLRHGLDHLRNINKEQVSRIELLGKQLLEAKNKLDFVEREKEMWQFREAESQGTIATLKEELDLLSKAKQHNWYNDEEENGLMMTDLEQLRFENELFAAQVVENEKKLRAVTQSQKETETENAQLKQEVEVLRASLNEALSHMDAKEVDGPSIAAERLLGQVAILSARFDQGEQERMTMALAFDEKLREKEIEIENIRGLLEQDHEENQRGHVVALSTAQGETELQLRSTKHSKKGSTNIDPTSDKAEPVQAKNECGAWRLLSDCLPG